MHVVEYGNYTATSRAIGVPKSTISQRITGLERAVGTGLLRRTSRSFSLTEAGSLLLPHARAIEELARKVERSLLERGRDLSGTLRVSCSNVLSQFALSPLIPAFLAQHRDVAIRIEASNRLVDIVAEGFDMAIRAHHAPLKSSSLVQRVVARAQWTLVASPTWIESHGPPSAPSELPAEEALCFSTTSECPAWTLQRHDEVVTVPVSPRLISDDMATLRATAIGGAGIACLPAYLVERQIRRGALVLVLPDWSPPSSSITVLTPPRDQSSRLASAFSGFLSTELPQITRR